MSVLLFLVKFNWWTKLWKISDFWHQLLQTDFYQEILDVISCLYVEFPQ